MSLRPLAAVAFTGIAFAAAVALQNAEVAPPPRPLPDPTPLTTSPPHYWKGNLHTHSLWSDGDDFPEMIVDWYKRHGYQFLAPDRPQRPRRRREMGGRRRRTRPGSGP